jgi:CheY-like chemotaxis protein
MASGGRWVRQSAQDGSKGVACLSTQNGSPGSEAPSVLIVDDDEEIRHVLRLLFEFEGFSIIGEASNGIDAISLAIRHQPDFVVLDYRMPRLDGEATAKVLDVMTPDARLVAFSAVLERKPEWADAYLNKDHIVDIAPLLTALIPDEAPTPAT